MSEASVAVMLTLEQRAALKLALGADEYAKVINRAQSLSLTATNIHTIREKVVALHAKKFKQKTKNADLMQLCFSLERIVDKIDDRLEMFGFVAPEEVDSEESVIAPILPQTIEEARQAIVNSVSDKASDEGEETDG